MNPIEDDSVGAEAGVDLAVSFDAFVADFHRTLLHALVAAVGIDQSQDAAAAGFAYAWENWDRIRLMGNPRGYVYRTARNAANRANARVVVPFPVADRSDGHGEAWDREIEPGLTEALWRLPEQQRSVVYLVEGYGLGLTEAAAVLDVSVSTVRSHLARGLDRLRSYFEVTADE